MVVAGASRHAKEILELLYQQNRLENLWFFDDYNLNAPDLFFEKFRIVKSLGSLSQILKKDNSFVLGLGGVKNRLLVANKIKGIGGKLISVKADSAKVGHFEVNLGDGLNIMEFVSINNCVRIGEGTLINAFASIHHDVFVGGFCEISPRATLLGGVRVGNFCSIGSGAIILPNVTVGQNVIVGAGAIVTRNVPDNSLVFGVPAKLIKKLEPLIL